MDYPLVTIVTATRNRRDVLKRLIESVRAQTYPNIEHVVVDGLSGDGTLLFTGFRRLRSKVVATGEERTFPLDYREDGKADTSQVCNVSMQPGTWQNPHLLLLDFGHPDPNSMVGRAFPPKSEPRAQAN